MYCITNISQTGITHPFWQLLLFHGKIVNHFNYGVVFNVILSNLNQHNWLVTIF